MFGIIVQFKESKFLQWNVMWEVQTQLGQEPSQKYIQHQEALLLKAKLHFMLGSCDTFKVKWWKIFYPPPLLHVWRIYIGMWLSNNSPHLFLVLRPHSLTVKSHTSRHGIFFGLLMSWCHDYKCNIWSKSSCLFSFVDLVSLFLSLGVGYLASCWAWHPMQCYFLVCHPTVCYYISSMGKWLQN